MSARVMLVAGWARRHVLLLVLVVVHLALKAYLFTQAVHSPLSGDESYYVGAAMATANFVRDVLTFQGPAHAEIARSIVSNGWFMPGSSILLAPLYLVVPHPGVAGVRAYMGVATELMLLLAVLATRRWIGRPYAYALLVCPALLPMWLLFSFTTWGDPAGGLAIMVLFAFAVRLALGLRDQRVPTVRDGLVLGLLGIATLYLRSSSLPLVAGVFALTLVALLTFLTGRRLRLRAAGSLAVAVAVFGVLLAPWSFAVSTVMRAPVVTTTTVPLSMAVTFGDPNRLCFGPCDPGNIWFNAVRYSREVGRMTGTSEVTVQKQMSDYALTGVTAHQYASDVLGDMGRYVLQPTAFVARFRAAGQEPDLSANVVTKASQVGYFAFAAAMVVALLLVARRSFRSQVVSTLLKLFMAALLIQPFVHIASGRYWPVFAPLFGVAAALLVVTVRESRRPAEVAPSGGPGSTSLVWVQAALAVGFVLVVAVLAVVGA